MLYGMCPAVPRNRLAFAQRGFALAFVDPPSDGQIRQITDVSEVIRYVRARDAVSIWLVGGSLSTAALAHFATALPASDPIGAVFHAPYLVPPEAGLIRRPTFVIYHAQDPLQVGASFFASLSAAPVKQEEVMSGGDDQPCGGLIGFHTFQGLDSQFVTAVAGFVDKHNASLSPPTSASVVAVEFFNASLDHYFVTHIANEIALLDAGTAIKGWTRTGQSFNVYQTGAADSSPVCRYYIPPNKGDSHFYGRGTTECAATGTANPSFVNEDPQFFHVLLPTNGDCPAGTRNVYRVFSNCADANHRYLVDVAIRNQMVTLGWLAEGDGANLVVMCSPI